MRMSARDHPVILYSTSCAFRRCVVVVEGVVTARAATCAARFVPLLKLTLFAPGTPFVNAPSEFTQSARAPFVSSAAFSGTFVVFIYLFLHFPRVAAVPARFYARATSSFLIM